MIPQRFRPACVTIFFVSIQIVFGARLGEAFDEPVDFSREILPLLSDRCFHCHGPDDAVREADLRLDKRDSAISDNGNGAAVVPGKSDLSELLRRITSEDEDERMPPVNSGRKGFTPKEIERFRKWIDQGAPWGKHWSFELPVRKELPIKNKQAIDSFVIQRLKKEGLSLSQKRIVAHSYAGCHSI